MIISERLKNLPASPIRELGGFVQQAKKAGKKIIPLNIGQPDVETPKAYFDAIKNFALPVVAYGDSHGDPNLIEAMRKYFASWGINYTADNIYITNGGSEAVGFAVMSLCDVDDEIIMFEPFYANYKSYTQSYSAKIVPVSTEAENGYHLPDAATIEKAITPRTKAIFLTNPGNPTGVVYTDAEMQMIANIVVKHNLALISDEVYREFVYDGVYKSFASMPELEDSLIVIDSVSKRFSACGVRIGSIITKNKELSANLIKCCQSRLCPPALEQMGAAALYTTPTEYFQRVNAEYKKRRDTIKAELAKIPGLVASDPKGAFYVMVKLPVDDTVKFAKWLLTDFEDKGETILIAPGYGFYQTPDKGINEARLAYVINSERLTRAIYLLGKGLEQYNKINK